MDINYKNTLPILFKDHIISYLLFNFSFKDKLYNK